MQEQRFHRYFAVHTCCNKPHILQYVQASFLGLKYGRSINPGGDVINQVISYIGKGGV